jgi:uncharacterized protein (TIGR03032 family)
MTASAGFADWLGREACSLVVTTSEGGEILLVGEGDRETPTMFARSVGRCHGVAVRGTSVMVARAACITQFEPTKHPGAGFAENDMVLAPRITWHTGPVFAHDVGWSEHPLFVNTSFSCLCSVGANDPFVPVWIPPWISRVVPEDRCHLNGLAMNGWMPAYVTAVGVTDSKQAWARGRHGGGVLVDVETSEIVCRGLSMPHSPRMRGDRVYLTNAGTGEFGMHEGHGFVPICGLGGFARGLCFTGDYALVGTSMPRRLGQLEGLPIARDVANHRCRLHVVSMKTGRVVHWIDFSNSIREIYDVAAIPGVRSPAMVQL